MQCNIDARGQFVRRLWGILCIALALGAAAAAFFVPLWWLYIVAALLLAGGLFAFWEARKKWCVIRALGVKTPL